MIPMEEQLLGASENGNIEEVKRLLNESNIDLNYLNSELKRTPLSIACYNGHIEIVKLLLNERKVDVNKGENSGATPFFSACENGNIEVVKELLKCENIDINKVDKNEASPFWIACSKGHIEIVESMLACRREVILDVKNNKGKTAIDVAKEGEKEGKQTWESEERFQRRKDNCTKIIELLELYQKNPKETRLKLRIQLGLASKNFISFLFFYFN